MEAVRYVNERAVGFNVHEDTLLLDRLDPYIDVVELSGLALNTKVTAAEVSVPRDPAEPYVFHPALSLDSDSALHGVAPFCVRLWDSSRSHFTTREPLRQFSTHDGTPSFGTFTGSQKDAVDTAVYGTSALNTTSAQTLAITVTHGGSNSNESFTREMVVTEFLQ